MSPRGRGRPTRFDTTQRELYLTAVASGASLADAATLAGITRQWANRVAANEPAFHTARELAKKKGKRARIDQLPHDEYRYNHHKCPCHTCRTAATQGRHHRRHPDTPAPADRAGPAPPPVIDLHPHQPPERQPGPPPLLARAS